MKDRGAKSARQLFSTADAIRRSRCKTALPPRRINNRGADIENLFEHRTLQGVHAPRFSRRPVERLDLMAENDAGNGEAGAHECDGSKPASGFLRSARDRAGPCKAEALIERFRRENQAEVVALHLAPTGRIKRQMKNVSG